MPSLATYYLLKGAGRVIGDDARGLLTLYSPTKATEFSGEIVVYLQIARAQHSHFAIKCNLKMDYACSFHASDAEMSKNKRFY